MPECCVPIMGYWKSQRGDWSQRWVWSWALQPRPGWQQPERAQWDWATEEWRMENMSWKYKTRAMVEIKLSGRGGQCLACPISSAGALDPGENGHVRSQPRRPKSFTAPFLPQPSLMALTWVAATLGHPWLRPRRVLATADGGDDRAQVGRLWA